MSKLEGIKEGDTVEVTLRGVVEDCSGVLGIIPDGGTDWTGFDPSDIASPFFSIKKVEPPIAVGDRVRVTGTSAIFEVVGPPRANMHGAEIVAVWSEHHGYGLYGATSLERVS